MANWPGHLLAFAATVIGGMILVIALHNIETALRTWWLKRHPEAARQPLDELAELHDWMDAKLAPALLAVDRTRRVRRRGHALEYTTSGSGVRRALVFVTTPDIEFVDRFFSRDTDDPPHEYFPDYFNRSDQP